MKKSNRTHPKAVTDASDQADFLEPIATERYTTDHGNRMTRVTFGKASIQTLNYSPDEIFTLARQCPEVLDGSWKEPWHIIRPWLHNDASDVKAFWKTFNTPAAEKSRKVATRGAKFVNWERERALIGLVGVFVRIQSPKSSPSPHASQAEATITGTDSGFADLMLRKLGRWVVDAVADDHEAPRRLHQLLKNPAAAEPETSRVRINADIFLAFARLVGAEEKLPTKKQVRIEALLGEDIDDPITASRAFRQLGLGGLPEA